MNPKLLYNVHNDILTRTVIRPLLCIKLICTELFIFFCNVFERA